MDLFVYGPLQSHDLMAAVVGGVLPSPQIARLHGYACYQMDGDVVPFIAKTAGATVKGRLWTNIDDAQLLRLNLYLSRFDFRLEQMQVDVDGKTLSCHGFCPQDDSISGAEIWELSAWEHTHLRPAIYAAEELFSLADTPTPQTLRRMWPMIEARAWAKYRATAAPATLRRKAKADDVKRIVDGPQQGSFHRLQNIRLQHRTFQGDMSDPLFRDVFFGVDAALVLPFDPVRETIALVEQVRIGPIGRRDPNPWVLEPIAGIVDAREDPSAAAQREAYEEAGLTMRHLEPAGSFYPSPGASTDYFYCYVGLCDLPPKDPYLGGLDEEAEDLLIHTLTLDDAFALARSGEIAGGPLLYLLYWLLAHRDQMRTIP